MSDNWIALIPEDPHFIPDATRRKRARDRFAEIAPDADDIKARVSHKVKFFDCGGNLERILCPSCKKKLPEEWWEKRMDEDNKNGGFRLAKYPTPCCQALRTLHELVYDWPQGFGQFALDAMNPNIGRLKPRDKKDLEEILGTQLRVIYQHI